MLRWLLYLGSIFVVMLVLRELPLIGGWFRIPLVGFFTSAALVGFLGRTWAEKALERRHTQNLIRRHGGVETPHNRGKIGSALEASGRFRAALPHFEAASEGEPDSAEWSWRRGRCLLELRRVEEATAALERALELDPEIGYGAARLQLAWAHLASGDGERALEAVELAERFHGPSPESAFKKARILKSLGRKEDAARSLAEVSSLAKSGAAYQRSANREWVSKAIWMRLFG